MKQGLVRASFLRTQLRTNKRATEEIAKVLEEACEGELKKHNMRSCKVAARKMEEILFSVGGAERIMATLRYFKDRPAMREVAHARDLMTSGDKTSNQNLYLSKEEKLNAIIVSSLKGFLGMFQRERTDEYKGGGRRSCEDQNAYDSIIAALMSNDLDAARLGRMLSKKLNLSYRQMKRGRATRKSMEDMDKKRWIRRSSAVPKSAIGAGTSMNVVSCLGQ